MADQVSQFVFDNYHVYVNDAKEGLAQKATLDLQSGSESVVCDEGHVGVTKGKKMAKLSLTAYSPLGGTAVHSSIYRAWKSRSKVPITLGPIEGQLLKIGMNVMSLKLDMDASKGTNMFDAELEGGEPDES